MKLDTEYLGLKLSSPFVAGASPLSDDLDAARELADAGASALVMHSLFEEQIRQEQVMAFVDSEVHAESFAEATSYFPEPSSFDLGPDAYLEQVRRLKDAVAIPVLGSLNGVTEGGWLDYAALIEEAGADGLELNVFFLATDPTEGAWQIEDRLVEIVRTVSSHISIPVAVKLSPFFTALPHLASRLVEAGATGLVLFNRFYQPDIDPVELEAVPSLQLSDSSELLLRLRWLAILHGRVEASLAATGGIHGHLDAVKALMAGADVVQLTSALLRSGPAAIGTVRAALAEWLEEMEYESLDQLRGSMSLRRSPDPAAFTRGNYAKILQSWDGRRRARGEHLFN